MLLHIAAALAGPPVHPSAAPIDWTAAGDEAARILSGYIQVQSVNPPGNETEAARYLGAVLDAEGIPYEITEFAPGRGSLVARLPGSGGQKKPLCLLSHLDVVTAEPARWERPPFSGEISDGYVWGRGALDMKGMGTIELLTLVWLQRLGVPLDRDVVLLAVADEEDGGAGIAHAIERWSDIGCDTVVNEGGLGIRDLFFEGQTVFAISVAEKGAMWMRMVATGDPGHGSTPTPGRAPERLQAALARLAEREDVVVWDTALLETFRRVGEQHGGLSGAILQSPALVKLLVKKRLLSSPPTRAALTNTVNVTGFGGALKPNVVPSEVWASLDVRILPGTDPATIVPELTALVDDPSIRFDVMSVSQGSRSPVDDPFFAALATRSTEGRTDAVAGPVMSIGYTDSNALRPIGVRAYGLVPFEVSDEELSSMHGDDERVSVENLRNGLRILLNAVLDVSASPG